MNFLVILLLVVPGSVGAALLLRGAVLEGRFLLEPARRLGRSGGLWMMCGGAPLLLLLLLRFAARDPVTQGTLVLLAATGIGLLSGLSRKPRPGGYAAATLWALGLILVFYGSLTAG